MVVVGEAGNGVVVTVAIVVVVVVIVASQIFTLEKLYWLKLEPFASKQTNVRICFYLL